MPKRPIMPKLPAPSPVPKRKPDQPGRSAMTPAKLSQNAGPAPRVSAPSGATEASIGGARTMPQAMDLKKKGAKQSAPTVGGKL